MSTLIGDRVHLREFNFNDWIDVHKYASQEIVCRFQPWGPNNEEQTQVFVRQILEDAKKTPRNRFVFAIIEQSTGKMIGAGEINIRSRTNLSGEIAYIIHPDYWGKGIATEVAKLLVNCGFKEFHLHRIYATCDPRNIGSAKVLSKVGMTQEGRLRDALLIKDGWRDSLVFGILQYEWDKVSL
ncbi:GNAT family protein [Paenibacillus qinlingensis]|uniref:RimJ/RimL family protein N-acetyltransferase n=1 Tax=Paenibacillus qinlingensis TaxID=1837343 RepID=A0ABU1NYP8_9BACL|nr:GNAT family protein [Paenibacillus qinlingensis]MDR6552608.1 RimJ/RimL family protein N-acetyltransferase [Paenibacillus qinlingensis]